MSRHVVEVKVNGGRTVGGFRLALMYRDHNGALPDDQEKEELKRHFRATWRELTGWPADSVDIDVRPKGIDDPARPGELANRALPPARRDASQSRGERMKVVWGVDDRGLDVIWADRYGALVEIGPERKEEGKCSPSTKAA